MKQSKRNAKNERAKAEKRQSKAPLVSKYALKVRKDLERTPNVKANS
jgi:hypothetical protein